MVISILLAARNEEKNIINCLSALNKLDFPKDDFEVRIGNDISSDNTENLINEFIKDKPNFYLKNIIENIGITKGKANVLAQLAKEAKGKYLLITDADIQVSPLWIKGMTKDLLSDIGVVTGFTIIKGDSIFAKLQSIDWLLGFMMIKSLSDLGIPVTTTGNNMLILKEAYFSVGGYENMPFSVTEDYALFKALIKKKWKFRNLMNKEVLAFSEPINSLIELLHQRKRWMYAAIKLPFYILFCLGIQALLLPILLGVFLLNPLVAISIGSAKIIFQSLVITPYLFKINKSQLFILMPIYEVYVSILLFSSLIFYFLPIKLRWKGRSY